MSVYLSFRQSPLPSGRQGIFFAATSPIKIPPNATPSSRSPSMTPMPAQNPPFEPEERRPEVSKSVTFPNIFDQPVTIELPFHVGYSSPFAFTEMLMHKQCEDQKDWFETIWKATTLNGGRPLYLSEDTSVQESSCVRIMTRDDFLRQSSLLPGYFKERHIVVMGEDLRGYKFDKAGLGTVFPAANTPQRRCTSIKLLNSTHRFSCSHCHFRRSIFRRHRL